MEPLPFLHLVFVSVWFGLVLGEGLLELVGEKAGIQSAAVIFHYWIDLFLGLPLILGIIVTGAILAARNWPLTPLLGFKIGAALVAIAANLVCVVFVIVRKKSSDSAVVLRSSRRIKIAGAVGVPFGLIAATIGIVHLLR